MGVGGGGVRTDVWKAISESGDNVKKDSIDGERKQGREDRRLHVGRSGGENAKEHPINTSAFYSA